MIMEKITFQVCMSPSVPFMKCDPLSIILGNRYEKVCQRNTYFSVTIAELLEEDLVW